MEPILITIQYLLISAVVFITFVPIYSDIVGEPLRIIHRNTFDYRYTQDELDVLMLVIKAHEVVENRFFVDDDEYYKALALLTKLKEHGVDVEYKSTTLLWDKLIIYYDVRATSIGES